jgi:hypothetical protein
MSEISSLKEKLSKDAEGFKEEAQRYGQMFGALSAYLTEKIETASQIEKESIQDLIGSQASSLKIPKDDAYKTLIFVFTSLSPADYMVEHTCESVSKLDAYKDHLDSICKIDDVESLIDVCGIFELARLGQK